MKKNFAFLKVIASTDDKTRPKIAKWFLFGFGGNQTIYIKTESNFFLLQ